MFVSALRINLLMVVVNQEVWTMLAGGEGGMSEDG